MGDEIGEQDDPARRLGTVAIERLVARRSADALGADAPEILAAIDQELGNALAGWVARAPGDPLSQLAARARLGEPDAALLAVAAAAEDDEALQQLIVSLTGDRERHRLEVWMLDDLLGAPIAIAAGPHGALQRAALLTVEQRGAFGRAALSVPPRVMWGLRGDRAADPALPSDTDVLTASAEPDGTEHAAVLVIGPDRTRRRQQAMLRLGAPVCLTLAAPADDASWAAVVREATLAGAAVIVDVTGPLEPAGRRWIERATHLQWALSSTAPIDVDRLPRLDWREFSADEHDPTQAEWEHALGAGTPREHRLSPDQLDRMRTAMAAHDGDFTAAFRRLTSPKLDELARHVRPRATWSDLVLSPGRTARLHGLVSRYRMASKVYDEWGFTASPSRGLVALFSGPSGTGKTLAAEVVAGQLGLDLYRLDLSSVVSKYIGETEKNLDELFDAAGMGNFVLFFDEADALFAKRGEVSDAHDRYANIETSYLLQRLERYDGVVVLATNYEKNIDQAFMRRIHVRIDFAVPTEAERLLIWQHHSKSGAPLGDDVDLAWLAKQFDLTGAAIRNAVIDAAFLAAAEGTPIGMSALVRGVARELRKLGRLVTATPFGEWFEQASTEAGD
jgi:hypothetical protein